jgi:hypothetical protein
MQRSAPFAGSAFPVPLLTTNHAGGGPSPSTSLSLPASSSSTRRNRLVASGATGATCASVMELATKRRPVQIPPRLKLITLAIYCDTFRSFLIRSMIVRSTSKLSPLCPLVILFLIQRRVSPPLYTRVLFVSRLN